MNSGVEGMNAQLRRGDSTRERRHLENKPIPKSAIGVAISRDIVVVERIVITPGIVPPRIQRIDRHRFASTRQNKQA